MAAVGDQAEAPAELQAQRAERLAAARGAGRRRTAAGRPRRPPAPRVDRGDLLGAEELRDRRAPGAVSSTTAQATALAPWRWTTSLSPSSSARDSARAPALSARTTPPPSSTRLEDLELRAAQQRRRRRAISRPKRRVGAVGAEAQHRLVVGHPRPRRRRRRSKSPHARRRAVMTASITSMTSSSSTKRHLEVELGELGLAVGAQVLVAEAARDLEVALEAGRPSAAA